MRVPHVQDTLILFEQTFETHLRRSAWIFEKILQRFCVCLQTQQVTVHPGSERADDIVLIAQLTDRERLQHFDREYLGLLRITLCHYCGTR